MRKKFLLGPGPGPDKIPGLGTGRDREIPGKSRSRSRHRESLIEESSNIKNYQSQFPYLNSHNLQPIKPYLM